MPGAARPAAARIVMDGAGFIGAAFRHRSSRAGDPLLHTHVVVANVTRGPDGRWTALTASSLYRHAKTAGYLYQAALRAELAERLPIRWLAVEHGTADLAGVTARASSSTSRERRAEILEHMAARGEHSARAAQVATLETRRRKDHDVPTERLRAEWRARAAEHGLDRTRLRTRLVQHGATETIAVRLRADQPPARGLRRPDAQRHAFHAARRRAGLRRSARASGARVARDRAPRRRVPRARRRRAPRARARATSRRTPRASCCEIERALLDGAERAARHGRRRRGGGDGRDRDPRAGQPQR